jgi:hypothetical protein
MKRFNITESEKNKILDLYKNRMLSEQTTTPSNTGKSVPIANVQMVDGKTVSNAPAAQTQNYTIAQLQDLLRERGYNVGISDSKLGTNTLAQIESAIASVKGFQGKVDQERQKQGQITTTTTTKTPSVNIPEPERQKSNEPEITMNKSNDGLQGKANSGISPLPNLPVNRYQNK